MASKIIEINWKPGTTLRKKIIMLTILAGFVGAFGLWIWHQIDGGHILRLVSSCLLVGIGLWKASKDAAKAKSR